MPEFIRFALVKKMAAILILILLLFNWVGYQLYITIAESAENQTMITRLDGDLYMDSDLISVKIPVVHLSPYANTRDFERVNGQIEIQGRVFNYVKRRISQDSLEFLCIPNDQATLLRIAKYDFFKLVTDLQSEQSKKPNANNSGHKALNGKYFAENLVELFPIHPSIHLHIPQHFIGEPSAGYKDFDGQPPQITC